jgi:hypothetical protein
MVKEKDNYQITYNYNSNTTTQCKQKEKKSMTLLNNFSYTKTTFNLQDVQQIGNKAKIK